jgi:DNA-binding NarL/FixJ family response regulator
VRVLVADDHAILRDGLRAVIEAEPGWGVVGEASTGREAVALATALRPDVALLDFSMPELNGLEATRQIRRACPATEVLILTMHESEQLARRCVLAGARAFLLKTDAQAQLVAALRALAQHQPYFSPAVSTLVLTEALGRGGAAP